VFPEFGFIILEAALIEYVRTLGYPSSSRLLANVLEGILLPMAGNIDVGRGHNDGWFKADCRNGSVSNISQLEGEAGEKTVRCVFIQYDDRGVLGERILGKQR